MHFDCISMRNKDSFSRNKESLFQIKDSLFSEKYPQPQHPNKPTTQQPNKTCSQVHMFTKRKSIFQ